MKNLKSAHFLFAIVCSVILHACGSGYAQRQWTEDVDLGDGRSIKVARKVQFQESNSWSGDSYNAEETASTIEFVGQLSSLPKWNESLLALLLYHDDETKEWVVVAKSRSCAVWEGRGRPKPPYWEFRLNQQGWREVPLSSKSFDRDANLFHRYYTDRDLGHLTLEKKISLVPRRPYSSMSSTEKSYERILAIVEPYNC